MDTFKLKTFLAEETKSPQVVLVQLKNHLHTRLIVFIYPM